MTDLNLAEEGGKFIFISFIYNIKKLFSSTCFWKKEFTFFTFYISVWDTLGISNSQIYRDMMQPMSQEFVTEVDEKRIKK